MKQNTKNRKTLLIILLGILILVALFGAFFFWNNSQTAKEQIDKPSFAFDETKAPGWWSGGNNWPNKDDFTADQITDADLPIADINVFQGTQNTPGDCFVMAFYKKGNIDITSTLKEREAGMIPAKDASALKQIGTVSQTIQTPEGTKTYTLYQYELDIPQVQKGNEFGFIPLSDSYIEVRGICPTADKLSTTLSGLSAIRLDP